MAGGLISGILPHSFCILLIALSALGAAIPFAVAGKALFTPYLLPLLIIISVAATVVSSAIYLKRLGMLNAAGIKSKWKYLTLMFSVTAAVNILMFFVIFPAAANMGAKAGGGELSKADIRVEIPCSGHAFLVSSALKKSDGVRSVSFKMPDRFEVEYDPKITSLGQIAAADVFQYFPIKTNELKQQKVAK